MSPQDNPLDFDEASTQLNEGLKSCRSVVQNYRMMLMGENGDSDQSDRQDGASESAANDF